MQDPYRYIRPKEITECPICREMTYRINYDTLERHCTNPDCGYSGTRRSLENVDMD